MKTDSLHAGAAKVDTTPPLGTVINGDFVTHYANLIHDPLFAKALVLRYGETTVAFVVVDICVMPKDFVDEVKALIREQTGLPPAAVLLSSTHTHAAGSVADVHLTGPDMLYRKKLPGLIAASVRQALHNLRPARIAFGSVAAPEHVLCRRYYMKAGYSPFNPAIGGVDQIKTNPFGGEASIVAPVAPTDPGLSYLAVKGLDDEWIALMGNYSLHYVGDWENGTISADYFGVFSEQVKTLLNAGDAFVGMMSNGTSGDINIWEFLRPERYPEQHFAKSKLIGSELAQKVVRSISHLEWQTRPEIAVRYQELTAAVSKPAGLELEAAKSIVVQSDYERLVPDENGLRSLYAREQVLLNEFPPALPCPLQVIRIGNGAIGALPGEFFAETGLSLKKQAEAAHYFTIGLANANVGYVPPAAEIKRGGYETWRCRYSCLEENAESRIRETLLQMIRSSFDSD